MKIADVMTKNPLTLKTNDTFGDVLKVLSKKKISGCPVVDSSKKIVGIVTQSDIIDVIDIHSNIHKTEDFLLLISKIIKNAGNIKDGLKLIENKKVREFMKKNIISIDANDEIYKAARLINKHNIDRLPVTKNKKLVGIISKYDIIEYMGK